MSIIEISLRQNAMIFIQALELARFKLPSFGWGGHCVKISLNIFGLTVEPSPERKAQHIDAGHHEQHRAQNRGSLVHEKQAHVE